MGVKFITKKIINRPRVKKNNFQEEVKPSMIVEPIIESEMKDIEIEESDIDTDTAEKNKKSKKKKDMITKEQISAIETAVEGMHPEVKVVKKDRGLIERTESSKIIITEDNRQVLND